MLRSVSPSPGMARFLHDQCVNNGDIVKKQLDAVLKLKGDGSKQLVAHSQYRVQCEVILKLANDRFAIQQALLRRAIRLGMFAEVWQFCQDMEQVEMSKMEPYRSDSKLLTELYYTALSVGNNQQAVSMYEGYSADEKKAVKNGESTLGILGAAASQARAGNTEKAADALKPAYVGALCDRHILDRHVLEQVSLLASKSIAASYAYNQRLADQTIREDSLRLLAGLSIRLGKGPELWNLMSDDRELKPTEKATAYLGFLEGIQATTGQ